MTEKLRAEMTVALADDAPDAALRILRLAFELAQHTVERTARGEGPLSAIEAVIGLDAALSGAVLALARVPDVLTEASAGRAVDEYVDQRAASVRDLADKVAAARVTFDELRESEQELRVRAGEHAELLERIRRLRRLERLVGALDEVSGQRAVVDERLAVLEQVAGAVDEGLTTATADLLRLSTQRLAVLTEPARATLAQAADAQARLAVLENEVGNARVDLDAATARHAALAAERDQTLAALRLHAEADRAVAAALLPHAPGAEGESLTRLLAILNEVRDRLAEVDAALGGHLGQAAARQHQQAQARAWTP
ncbi:hypothetical protein AB0B66_34010 [Catellatospora sp. NPDC049111]|uniref:hypothetical protein n=1 Tax=Catellatospora sp. NPDC049111 TaxID=3155271 RepID=UPI003410CB8D